MGQTNAKAALFNRLLSLGQTQSPVLPGGAFGIQHRNPIAANALGVVTAPLSAGNYATRFGDVMGTGYMEALLQALAELRNRKR